MTDSSHPTDATTQPLTYEGKQIVELMRLCRVMLLYGEPGAQRNHLLRADIMLLLQAVRPSDAREIVVLFDAWGGPPLTALRAHTHTALAQITTQPIPDGERGRSLADTLRSWQEAYNATFLIIFDRFNEYLIAPPERDGMREFEDEFAQAVNDTRLRANFLLVLDQDAEPLLKQLRNRIPFLGNDSVRLPSAKLSVEQPVQFSQTDAAFVAVAQQAGGASPMGADTSATPIQRTEFANRTSIHWRKDKPMLALAIVVLICSVVAAGVWFSHTTPQPAAPLMGQRATPSGSPQENAGPHPMPEKSSVVDAPREGVGLNNPKQPATLPKAAKKQSASAAPKATEHSKPKAVPSKPRAIAARPGNTKAGATKDNPKSVPPPTRTAPASSDQPVGLAVPPAEPARTGTPAAAIQPQPTIDQVYAQRAGKECERGLLGVVCREKIRYQLCAGKWTRDEQTGMARCYVW